MSNVNTFAVDVSNNTDNWNAVARMATKLDRADFLEAGYRENTSTSTATPASQSTPRASRRKWPATNESPSTEDRGKERETEIDNAEDVESSSDDGEDFYEIRMADNTPAPIAQTPGSGSSGPPIDTQPSVTPTSTKPAKRRKTSHAYDDLLRRMERLEQTQLSDRVKTIGILELQNKKIDQVLDLSKRTDLRYEALYNLMTGATPIASRDPNLEKLHTLTDNQQSDSANTGASGLAEPPVLRLSAAPATHVAPPPPPCC